MGKWIRDGEVFEEDLKHIGFSPVLAYRRGELGEIKRELKAVDHCACASDTLNPSVKSCHDASY